MAKKENKQLNIKKNTVDVVPVLNDVTKVFVFIILSVFPLLIGPGGYTNITEFKFKTFVILSVAYLLCLLVIPIVMRAKAKVKRTEQERIANLKQNAKKLGLPGLFLCLYVLWSTLSAILSLYWQQTFIGMSRYEGWLSIFLYAAICIGVALYGKFDGIYVYAMAVSSFIFGIIAFAQQMGSKFLYPEGYAYYDSRFLSTFGHEDCYSMITSLFIPVLLCGYVLLEKKESKKFDFRFITLPSLFLLTFTFLYSDVDCAKIGFIASLIVIPFLVDTRAHLSRFMQSFSFIALAFGLFFAVTIGDAGVNTFALGKKSLLCFAAAIVMIAIGIVIEKKNFEFKFDAKKIRIVLYILIVIAVVIVLIFFYNYKGDNRLATEFTQLLHGELTDRMGNGRGLIWKGSYKAWLKNPILGSGPGTFMAVYEEFNPWLAGGTAVDFAHNDFIQIGVCCGIVGLVLYLAFLFSLLIKLFKNQTGSTSAKVICAAGLIGYVAAVFFVFSIAICTSLYWILAALLMAEASK